MATTTFWNPNQAAVAQKRTYTFTAPSGIGNHYKATMNGKTVTYSSVSGDTAALAATGLFNLLNVTTGIAAEFTEITWTNPSDGVVVAEAKVPGTPFAGVAGTDKGLVLSTGNGLASGITTANTVDNASPSDVNDQQNWLRVNLSTIPPAQTRAIPVNGDDVDVRDSSVPMLWNLDQLAAVQFNTYTRWQTMIGEIGLPETNLNGYREWRATYFKFVGPQGSVPAGGLEAVLGRGSTGTGPSREHYDVGSQKTTLTVLAAGRSIEEYGIRFLGVHTDNVFKLLGRASLAVAMQAGEIANLSSSSIDGNARVGIGEGVTWTAASTLTMLSGSAVLGAAPATLDMRNGSQATIVKDGLTWATVTMQGGSSMVWLAGGTITTLTMTTRSTLDKSGDLRTLTITNSTIDGDTCLVNDPLNAIVWTNATSVKQQVVSGPFRFTGTRTVKVT